MKFWDLSLSKKTSCVRLFVRRYITVGLNTDPRTAVFRTVRR